MFCLSKREWLRQWRESPKVNSLLDTPKTYHTETVENEKLFYFAQKVTSRIGCISEEINISNEIFKQKELKQIELENELIFIWDELHKRYIYWRYQCWIIWCSNSIKVYTDWTFSESFWNCPDWRNQEYKILQRKLNQLVLKHHLYVVFVLIRQELQCKLFVMNSTSISTICSKKSSWIVLI